MAGDILTDSKPTEARKARLKQYIYIKGEYDDYVEELTVLENNAIIPAMRESDGSKKGPSASDRMGNATIRYMEYKDKVKPALDRLKAEMDFIENAISEMENSLERQVLRLRYIRGDDGGVRDWMPWRKVALRIYKSDDDAKVQLVQRIHGRALQHIRLEAPEE